MDFVLIKKIPGKENVEMAILENGGYCPCKFEQIDENKCMCDEFTKQESGECSCGLYSKVPVDYILFTKDGCPRCEILRSKINQSGLVCIETNDITLIKDTSVLKKHGFPLLLSRDGSSYNFKSAVFLIDGLIENSEGTLIGG